MSTRMNNPNSPNPLEWDERRWKELITSVISFTIYEGEYPEDIAAAAWLLGQRRAALMDHKFWPGTDPIFPLKLGCWWPVKEKRDFRINDRFIDARRRLLFGFYQSRDIGALQSVFTDNILRRPESDFEIAYLQFRRNIMNPTG